MFKFNSIQTRFISNMTGTPAVTLTGRIMYMFYRTSKIKYNICIQIEKLTKHLNMDVKDI